MKNIKFISYDGKFPCLCMGVLTVQIDGKIYKFGHHSEDFDCSTYKYNDQNFDSFWRSGGRIEGDWGNLSSRQGEWELCVDCLYPEEIDNILLDLIKIFNENVPEGCCGGCI